MSVDTIACPECDVNIEVEDIEIEDVIECSECGTDFVVTGTNPITLSEISDEDEEEEEDDDEDDAA